MDKLKILYAVAIGVGLGGITFAITYQLFSMVRKRLRRRRELAAR